MNDTKPVSLALKSRPIALLIVIALIYSACGLLLAAKTKTTSPGEETAQQNARYYTETGFLNPRLGPPEKITALLLSQPLNLGQMYWPENPLFFARAFNVLVGLGALWFIFATAVLLAPDEPRVVFFAVAITSTSPKFISVLIRLGNTPFAWLLISAFVYELIRILNDNSVGAWAWTFLALMAARLYLPSFFIGFGLCLFFITALIRIYWRERPTLDKWLHQKLKIGSGFGAAVLLGLIFALIQSTLPAATTAPAAVAAARSTGALSKSILALVWWSWTVPQILKSAGWLKMLLQEASLIIAIGGLIGVVLIMAQAGRSGANERRFAMTAVLIMSVATIVRVAGLDAVYYLPLLGPIAAVSFTRITSGRHGLLEALPPVGLAGLQLVALFQLIM